MPTNHSIHGTGIKLQSAIVTGATGHIGSALVRRLAADGVQVSAVVRKDSSTRSMLSFSPLISLIETDALDSHALSESLAGVSADVVFNLASAGVNPANRDPITMLDGNVRFLTSLMSALEKHRLRRFIHTGSCAEYAPAKTGHRLTESDPVQPPTLYGAAKLCASLYGAALATERKLSFVNLRLFGVLGIGEAPHRIVPYLIARLRENQPVDLTPGQQIRDWLYIDDVVEALLAAATCANLGDIGTYNVCSGHGISVRELAEQVAGAMNKSSDLLRFGARPYRSDEPMWIVGDNRRFLETVDWHPRVPIADGIRRMVTEAQDA